MKRPDPEVVKALALTVRQFPVLLTWLSDWKKSELDALPYNANNVAVAQGRCQVLGELVKLAKDSPDIVANTKTVSLF